MTLTRHKITSFFLIFAVCMAIFVDDLQAAEVSQIVTVGDNQNIQIISSEDNIFSSQIPVNALQQDVAVYLNSTSAEVLPPGSTRSNAYSFYLLSVASLKQAIQFNIKFSSFGNTALQIWYRENVNATWQRQKTKIDSVHNFAYITLTQTAGQLILMEQEKIIISQPTAKNKYSSSDQIFSIIPLAPWSGQIVQIDTRNLETLPTLAVINNDLVYHYQISNTHNNKYNLQLKYRPVSEKMPLLYFLNDQQQWQMLDSKIDLKKELIIATTEQPELFILVAYQPDSWLGRATWYHYRKCLCAASRDYPKGTKLKVTNINNNKSVIVKINDYGPEKWTKNLIDLDAVAFKKISSLRAGVINVKIEKIP